MKKYAQELKGDADIQKNVDYLMICIDEADNTLQIIEDFSDELYNYMNVAILKNEKDAMEKIGVFIINFEEKAKFDRLMSLNIVLANAFDWKFIVVNSKKKFDVKEIAEHVMKLIGS